jgi:hypothetical protein
VVAGSTRQVGLEDDLEGEPGLRIEPPLRRLVAALGLAEGVGGAEVDGLDGGAVDFAGPDVEHLGHALVGGDRVVDVVPVQALVRTRTRRPRSR